MVDACVALRRVVSPLLFLTSAMLVRTAAFVPPVCQSLLKWLRTSCPALGVDRVLTVDLHAEQIQGFFDVPVDNVFGSPILLEDMLQLNLDNPIVVSPDIGGVVRARAIAKLLNDTDMAIIDKTSSAR
ncbi:Ribose-phosphate pyrophosphokinase [Raoultella terrigena]|uniref:ribose-phosphate diphosphokinase n=1 Tax=Raoultella terrigena TaxID=577 RepID=A0A4U9D130_RAOTE|nr:Ribose-phosphate pyrophosphokinase [Raoultella terrigena]